MKKVLALSSIGQPGCQPLPRAVFDLQNRPAWVDGQDQKSSSGPAISSDNIYAALEDFRSAEWTTSLLGADVKSRYADLKQGSADRCPRLLGTFVKAPEVQYHHDVYNQFLWNKF